jgi:hypothetical protein
MPRIPFKVMPDSARVWVFGAAAPLVGAAADTMLATVDEHLAQWKAHGVPLVCARDWRDDRFLAIAVDEAATDASGCSIDGLFRVLSQIEATIGTSMVDGSMIFWRDDSHAVRSASRPEFRRATGVTVFTPVFDTTVNTVGSWRRQFERPAGDSWHRRLLSL